MPDPYHVTETVAVADILDHGDQFVDQIEGLLLVAGSNEGTLTPVRTIGRATGTKHLANVQKDEEMPPCYRTIMVALPWVGDALEDVPALSELVDRETAVEIARTEDLGIREPEERVDAFITGLPDLFQWFRLNHRDYPWRRTRDSWEVLVAEILLQRTKARYVDDLYEDFLEQFPHPQAIYRADESEIFEAVETLGFGNKRTRTLSVLAAALVEHHDGVVPSDSETLQELPRIGPYTARACLCFAYGQPLALVDTNIGVVVERVFGYSSSRRAHKDQALYAFLDALIPADPDLARIFNLALLDLRDAICMDPPHCDRCPLNTSCLYATTPAEN